jgi:ribosomal-protein-alanine N-acetyltransferase
VSRGVKVALERPTAQRAEDFLKAVARSRRLHANLVTPPATRAGYENYLKYAGRDDQAHFFVIDSESNELAGAINIGVIVRGYFYSAPMGYYAFAPHDGQGFMRAGLVQAITYAFRNLKLHRLEANIQPENARSIRLVQSLGFRLEGYSPKYLKISGRWRDHERWAILTDEWHPRRVQ